MNTCSQIFLRETDDADDCRACGHQQCLGTGPSSAMLCLPSGFFHKTYILYASRGLQHGQLLVVRCCALSSSRSVSQSEFSRERDLVLPLSASRRIQSGVLFIKLSSRRTKISFSQKQIFKNLHNTIHHLTLPAWLTTCHLHVRTVQKFWKPQTPGALRVCPGLSRDSLSLLYPEFQRLPLPMN